jgi:hypothetical protein
VPLPNLPLERWGWWHCSPSRYMTTGGVKVGQCLGGQPWDVGKGLLELSTAAWVGHCNGDEQM